MAVPLPKYVAFTSTSKTKFIRPSGSASLLKYEEADIFSRGVKHEIVKSKSEPGKFHIRCVDTGKYWTWGFDSDSRDYIAAQATNPLSDRSSNACTLVKARISGGVNALKLSFLRNSEWQIIRKGSGETLKIGKTKDPELYHEFIIVDWEQLARATKNAGGGAPAPRGILRKIPGGGANGNQKQITGVGASNGVVEESEHRVVYRPNGVVEAVDCRRLWVVYKK